MNQKVILLENVKNKKTLGSSLFNSGKFLFEQKKYNIALEKFEMAKKTGCKRQELYSFLAECYIYCNKDSKKALDYARKGLRTNYNNISIHAYALSLYFCNKYTEALKYLYLLKDTKDDDINVWIADINFRLKNFFEAYKYINKIKDISHFDTETKINIFLISGKIQYNLDMKDLALKIFFKAYHMGDNDYSLCYISQIYFDYNQPVKAVKYLYRLFGDLLNLDVKNGTKLKDIENYELQELLESLINRDYKRSKDD